MARAYRKKPVVVEAVQWTGENHAEMCEFIDSEAFDFTPRIELVIHTLEGDHHASPGDYIIKGVNGEFYPCKPDIFAKTYESSTLTQPPITGDTSDGYHTFNELYHHRAVLFSVICNERPEVAWKSKRHHDGTMYDGMFIVGIDTPEGQATYHYDIDPYWDMFHVKELELAPEWDGHTPGEAIRRIGTLTQPNEPLTWEELKQMAGEPVYIVEPKKSISSAYWVLIDEVDEKSMWCVVGIGSACLNFYKTYGKTWLAYRRPPEGEA